MSRRTSAEEVLTLEEILVEWAENEINVICEAGNYDLSDAEVAMRIERLKKLNDMTSHPDSWLGEMDLPSF